MSKSNTVSEKSIGVAEIRYLQAKGHRITDFEPVGLECLRLDALIRGYAVKAGMSYEDFADAISSHYESEGRHALPSTHFKRVA